MKTNSQTEFPAPTQLDLFSGAEKRDKGIAQAINHADAVSPGWSKDAFLFLLNYMRTHSEFMGEEVRTASEGILPEPPDKRAWGAIMVRAVKSGLLVRKEYRSVTNPKAHKSICSVWQVVE